MNLVQKAENLLIVRAIRSGLINTIPVLLVGAFALVFKSFPVAAYQEFISTLGGGFLLDLFDLIIKATYGVLAVYVTLFVSHAYMGLKADPNAPIGGAVVASLSAFFIFAGIGSEGFGLDNLGAKSVFMSILTGLAASAIYLALHRVLLRKVNYTILSRGADANFNRMLTALAPIVLTAIIFAYVNTVVAYVFHVDSFNELIIVAFNRLFEGLGPSFEGGFFFVLLSSVLWFFGIHGSDALESVMQEYFVPGLEANQAAVAVGADPTFILTKQFFDCFVLIGGCGTTICLLIAILVFSRNHSRRRLGVAASVPMIFNINEIMVFGLPIIYNPIMLIPFLATPIACYIVAYLATSCGLVPVVTGNVEWTTPALIGGYYATGSAAGSLLQLFNIVMGMLIYMPFVRMLDRQTDDEARRVFDDFMAFFKNNEAELSGKKLIEQEGVYGEFAKNLTGEFQHDMRKGLQMHYQPQYNHAGVCVGVESLLRWKHPLFGMLYPPLVIKLAEDGGFLPELEEAIMQRVLSEADRVKEKFGADVKISFNITGTTVVTDRFQQFCKQLNEEKPFADQSICIEVTEQAALAFEDATIEALRQLHAMGLKLAIDDFSMGHTSINYLKENLFDYIKLDGSLVKGLMTHENCREIVSSVAQLADSLHMTVIAEYVETEEQRDILYEIGCDCYQGWLYSPAVPLD